MLADMSAADGDDAEEHQSLTRPSPASAARAVVAALVLVVTASSPARANGAFETFGVSPRTKGMANAVTAFTNGPEAAHYNPGGLSLSPSPEVRTAFSLTLPAVSFEMERDDVTPRPVSSFGGTLISGSTSLGPLLFDRVTAGFTSYTPSFVYTHASAPDPTVPFLYLYDTYTDHWELTPAVAIRWFDWFSTGIGVRIGAAQTGRIELGVDPLRNRITEQSIQARQIPIYAPTAGVTLGPLGWDGLFRAALGLSYREHLSLPMAIITALQIEGLDAAITMPVHMIANFSPRTFTAGLGVEILEHARLGVDLQYAAWSEAPTPYLAAEVYPHGDGVDDLGLLGALEAPGPGQSRIAPAGFVDTVNVRAGGELSLVDDLVALRAGYAYRPTPVPDQTTGTNIADATAHVIATGAGVALPLPSVLDQPLCFDLSWQTQLFEPRRTEKRRADDPTGNYVLRGSVSELSVGIGYRW